jgi:hypothetical protein
MAANQIDLVFSRQLVDVASRFMRYEIGKQNNAVGLRDFLTKPDTISGKYFYVQIFFLGKLGVMLIQPIQTSYNRNCHIVPF